MNMQAAINRDKLAKQGHDVGDEVRGVYGHDANIVLVVILEKKKTIIEGIFSYLVTRKDHPSYIAHAQTYKDGSVLIDNARLIGSDDKSMGVKDMAQARAEVWF